MAVTSRARTRQNKLVGTTTENTLIERKKPALCKREEFRSAKSPDAYCNKTWLAVEKSRLSFHFYKSRLLVRILKFDGALQKVVRHLVRSIILHLAYHWTLAGHSGKHRIYETIRRGYVWTNISTDIYSTVRRFQDCLQTEQSWSINISNSCFPKVACLSLLQLMFFAHSRELGLAANL